MAILSQGGNENDSFILSDPIEGILVMNKALDYDHGKREFKIQIQASVSGRGERHARQANISIWRLIPILSSPLTF